MSWLAVSIIVMLILALPLTPALAWLAWAKGVMAGLRFVKSVRQRNPMNWRLNRSK